VTQESDAAGGHRAIDAQFTSPLAVDIDDAPAKVGNHIIVFLSRRYVDGKMIDGSARAAAVAWSPDTSAGLSATSA
jgi:hypothetical protein